MKLRLCAMTIGGLLLSAMPSAHAQPKPMPRYTIEDVGAANRTLESITQSLNQHGQVCSWREFSLKGSPIVLWEGGKERLIPSQIEGYPILLPAGINAQGSVVGIAKTKEDNKHGKAFLWQEDKFLVLPGLGGNDEAAWALNASGQIVGVAQTPDKNSHACIWQDGKIKDLGTLPKGKFSIAEAINAQGWVVGVAEEKPNGNRRAVLWKEGKTIDLGIYPGGTLSHARAINDKGEIAGWVDTSDREIEAAVWRNGKLKKLEGLGDAPSSAWDINNNGQIVGSSSTPERRVHPCLWVNDKPYDINNLIPKGSGWRLKFAYRINDKGQILGVGAYKGLTRLFLATPVQNTATLSSRYCQRPATSPTENRPAPAFSLKDTEGETFSLTDHKGRPLVLFFFCGCKWCIESAKKWSEIQSSGVLKAMGLRSVNVPAPLTVVVFQGTAEEARAFASTTNLDTSQTRLLPDKQMKVTLPYHALPCPRAFVLNKDHKIAYTNSHADDAPQKATTATLIGRVLSALDGNPNGKAPQAPIPPTNAKLAVLAQNGVEKINETSARTNFGEVDVVSRPLLKRDFMVYNPGSTSLPLRVETTCGCTGAVVNSEGRETSFIGAKQTATISVTVHTAQLKPGSQSKYIYLFSDNDPVPIASLEVLAEVRSVVAFEPKTLDFGDLSVGSSAQKSLKVTLDARMLQGGKFPPLLCTSSSILLRPLSTMPTQETRNGRKVAIQRYQVSLSPDAPIGRVGGEIYFAPKTSPTKPTTEDPVMALGGVWAQVRAATHGEIAALSDVVVFGSLEAGGTYQRDAQIQAQSESVLRTLKLTPKQPYLSASLVDKQGASVYVRVVLGKQAPLGDGRGEVLLTTAAGHRLILKVLFNIYKPNR